MIPLEQTRIGCDGALVLALAHAGWTVTPAESIRGVLKNQGGYSTLLTTRGQGGLLKNPGGYSTHLSCGNGSPAVDFRTALVDNLTRIPK